MYNIKVLIQKPLVAYKQLLIFRKDSEFGTFGTIWILYMSLWALTNIVKKLYLN